VWDRAAARGRFAPQHTHSHRVDAASCCNTPQITPRTQASQGKHGEKRRLPCGDASAWDAGDVSTGGDDGSVEDSCTTGKRVDSPQGGGSWLPRDTCCGDGDFCRLPNTVTESSRRVVTGNDTLLYCPRPYEFTAATRTTNVTPGCKPNNSSLQSRGCVVYVVHFPGAPSRKRAYCTRYPDCFGSPVGRGPAGSLAALHAHVTIKLDSEMTTQSGVAGLGGMATSGRSVMIKFTTSRRLHAHARPSDDHRAVEKQESDAGTALSVQRFVDRRAAALVCFAWISPL
jgi:hypothetical protein